MTATEAKPPLRDAQTVREIAALQDEVEDLKRWLKVTVAMLVHREKMSWSDIIQWGAQHDGLSRVNALTMSNFVGAMRAEERRYDRQQVLATLTPKQREALGLDGEG